jgi:hypothetical protein
MVADLRQTQKSDEYRAWEGLIRAACASAAAQSPEVIRAVTVSHRIDQLDTGERDALLAFAQALAGEMILELETEESRERLVLRFSRKPSREPQHVRSEGPSGADLRAIWRRIVWQRNE